MFHLFVLLPLVLAGQSPATDCTPAQESRLAAAVERVTRGDDPALEDAGDDCLEIRLARLAIEGWTLARALAPKGGARELLGPVTATLARIDALPGTGRSVEAEYAQVAIRAAIAAAQDERPEMELLLAHARDLSERLSSRSRSAVWPRSVNLLAGELWHEVDRYDTARLAFERSVQANPTPIGLAGLARALARLGRDADACAAYRRVHDAAPAILDEARAFLVRCP